MAIGYLTFNNFIKSSNYKKFNYGIGCACSTDRTWNNRTASLPETFNAREGSPGSFDPLINLG